MKIKANNIDLRCDSCLEILDKIPNETVDFIFTDPPYKLIGGGRKNSLLRSKNNSNSPFSTSGECFNFPTPEFSDWVPKLYKVLKDNSYMVVMINDMNLVNLYKICEDAGFKFCELLVMKKNTKVPSLYFSKQCEYLLLFRKGKYKRFNKYGIGNVFEVIMPRGDNKKSPTEKPVEFIKKIIECLSNEGDIALDPFMGSGSTGIACIETNRNFIGIEIDDKYFNTAKERIERFKKENKNED